MARRQDILDQLITDLKLIDGNPDNRSKVYHSYTFQTNAYGNVFPQARFLDEIQDFPTLSVVIENEERDYIGMGVCQGELTLTVYVYSRGTTSQADANKLLDDVEHIILEFSNVHDGMGVIDSKVIELRPDNALLTPYGGASLTASILYECDEI